MASGGFDSRRCALKLAHFYHLYADGKWREPVAEHIVALRDSGFAGPMYVGMVGTPDNCREAWRTLRAAGFGQEWWSKTSGHEEVTVNALRAYAAVNDGAILYAHTKGAADASEFRGRWRRAMSLRVVEDWRSNLAALADRDAVGCHWLTAQQFPEMVDTPFFGGNYWMARCDYLRSLPPLDHGCDRFEAERWIGLNQPRVLNLLPGWPDDARWPEQCPS